MLAWAKEKYPFIKMRFVPARCTPVAQVLDTMVNRPFKHFIKQRYVNWSIGEMRPQLAANTPPSEAKLDLSLGVIKPLSLEWCMDAWEHSPLCRTASCCLRKGGHTGSVHGCRVSAQSTNAG